MHSHISSHLSHIQAHTRYFHFGKPGHAWVIFCVSGILKTVGKKHSPRKIQGFPPNFLVRRFSANGQFKQIFRRFARKSAETARLRKMSSPGN